MWVRGERDRIARAAETPPPGMRTSSRATSGCVSAARSAASSASAASAATSKPS